MFENIFLQITVEKQSYIWQHYGFLLNEIISITIYAFMIALVIVVIEKIENETLLKKKPKCFKCGSYSFRKAKDGFIECKKCKAHRPEIT